jgi:hypothetical protein
LRRAAAGWLLAALLGSCQSHPPATSDPGDTGWLQRLGPWDGPDQQWTQLATFRDGYNDAVHVLRFDVEFRSGRVALNAQTTLGVPLFVVTLTEGEVSVQRQPATPAALPVDRAVADFVLAVWPLDALSAALAGSGYTLEADAAGRRLLDAAGRLLVEIRGVGDSPGQSLRIDHHDIPLNVRIDTLKRLPSPG